MPIFSYNWTTDQWTCTHEAIISAVYYLVSTTHTCTHLLFRHWVVIAALMIRRSCTYTTYFVVQLHHCSDYFILLCSILFAFYEISKNESRTYKFIDRLSVLFFTIQLNIWFVRIPFEIYGKKYVGIILGVMLILKVKFEQF